jgi:DNA-binding beta-propeller fold protein YncE
MFAAATVSPDGKTLYASGDFGTRVYVFDTASLTLTTRYAVAGGVTGLAMSPDGARLYAIAGESLVRLDPATGQELGRTATGFIGMSRILHVASR